MKLKTVFFSTLFTGIQTLCSITVTGIAVWGVFFTDLPETLIRQLRSNVADAQEELVGTRRELRRVKSEYAATNKKFLRLKEKLAESTSKLEKSILEAKKLEEHRVNTERQLETVQKARKRYFDQTYRLVMTRFFSRLDQQVQDFQNDASKAASYRDFIKWLHAGEKISSSLELKKKSSQFRKDRTELIQPWEKWTESAPAPWNDLAASIPSLWLFNHFNGSNNDQEPWVLGIDVARKENLRFVKHITHKHFHPLTGVDILRRSLSESPIDLLTHSDQDTIQSHIKKFIFTNAVVFNLPIQIGLEQPVFSSKIETHGITILENLEKVGILIQQLKQHMDTLDQDDKNQTS